jgi:hypothetical protein
MMSLILMALLTLPTDVKVSTLDGQTLSGQLKTLTEKELTLVETGADVTLPSENVMSIEFPANAAAPVADAQALSLIDGSQLSGTGVVRNAKTLTMASPALGNLDIDNKAIQSVRLKADNPTFRSQWNTFQKRETDKDLLIVAKRDGSGLDFLAGVVSGIAADKIDFQLDGDAVPVPAARVYGVVFAKASDAATGIGTIKLTSVQGDVISAKAIQVADDSVKIDTAWRQILTLPLTQCQKIDLSGGRIQFLSDLEPIEEKFAGVDPEGSLFTGLINDEQQTLLFGPRRDSTMEKQSKIRLRGKEFTKGLCLHSKTEISWAIDKKFSSLDCLVGVDDEVAFNGKHSVALKISGDDQMLFEKTIATSDEPIPVRVPLEGISTLTIVVDYADGDSTCDWLDLADAKLLIAKPKEN